MPFVSRSAAALLAALLLAACRAPTPQLPPDPQIVRSYDLKSVTVRFTPDAEVRWGEGERGYARANELTGREAREAGGSEEGRDYTEDMVALRFRDAILARLSDDLAGTTPVRVEVVISRLVFPGAAQRVVLGGHHEIDAKAVLVDIESGGTILTWPGDTHMIAAGQGVVGVLMEQMMKDPIDRFANIYAARLERWILPPPPPVPAED